MKKETKEDTRRRWLASNCIYGSDKINNVKVAIYQQKSTHSIQLQSDIQHIFQI